VQKVGLPPQTLSRVASVRCAPMACCVTTSTSTMIQNFGGNGSSQTAQWFETNKYGLNNTSGIWGMV
jgi:hypothetical protein